MNHLDNQAGSGVYVPYKDGTSTAQAKPVTTSALTPVGQILVALPIQPQIAVICPPVPSAKRT